MVETEMGEFTEFITILLMPCIFIVSNVSAAASSEQLGDVLARGCSFTRIIKRNAYDE